MTTATGDAGIRVLIADDVAEFRTLLRVTLVLDGRFELAGEAGDGAETVELAATHQPDVVLLDLSMPVMDGLEVIPELRRRAPHTKIVVLSGFMASRLGVDVLERGAHAYVEKGADASELIGTLVELCRPAGSTPDVRSHVPRLTGLDLWRAADAEASGPAAASDVDVEARASAGTTGASRHPDDVELRHVLAGHVTSMQGLVATLSGGIERLPRSLVRDCVEELAAQLDAVEALLARPAPEASDVDAPDTPTRAAQDLSVLVQEVVDEVALRTGGGPPTVGPLPSVSASVDGDGVRHILRGMLEHAVDGPAGTTATVTLDQLDGRVEIAVARAAATDVSRLGPPPTREDRVALPMAELRAQAQAHGGDLLSVARDSGVEFVLRLPAG